MDEAIQGEWVGQEGQRAEPGTPGNTKVWKKGVGLAKMTEESMERRQDHVNTKTKGKYLKEGIAQQHQMW